MKKLSISEYDLTVSDIGRSAAIIKENLAVKHNPQKHSIFRSNLTSSPRSKHSMKTINIGKCVLLFIAVILLYSQALVTLEFTLDFNDLNLIFQDC